MGFKCGIVGLPNVGKSTLFNALTQTEAAEAANYPFATIEPNTGKIGVQDERLYKLAEMANSQKTIPTQLEFVDIAGLVQGASKGEGLGNQFLGNIREVDAICHVVRCFDDDNITHVSDSVDPVRDIEVIETELLLADMESLEKRLPNLERRLKNVKDKEVSVTIDMINRCLEKLHAGLPAREVELNGEDDEKTLKGLQLLTSKKMLYVCNVDDESVINGNDYSRRVEEHAKEKGTLVVKITAAIEAEVAQLDDPEERQEFLSELGLSETGLTVITRTCYDLLGLITFFTVGPKEARAWTVKEGSFAPQGAGVIHSDFERGFIMAETMAYDDYITLGGEQGAKDNGKLRQEGKQYVIQDADIFHFKFNV